MSLLVVLHNLLFLRFTLIAETGDLLYEQYAGYSGGLHGRKLKVH